ncbi:modulator of macroautophagy TMEM150B-like [Alosa pseudoharengus]|uniref:modulator of macroautophagy TMEM150B-like n=1 Tax=Alosa pseudoharengus TaxID=34774 RepID=UPI003F8AF7C8
MWTWALLPVVLAVGGIVGSWAVYAISVSNNTVNVTAKFPFISECDIYQPESALFCLFCIVWTLLIIWVVVIRYQQIREQGNLCRRANLAALVLGFIAASGVSILGSFPVRSLSLSPSLSCQDFYGLFPNHGRNVEVAE